MILVPGFIDGHMHVESTKLRPAEFARAALPHGTTTVVIDPHEIGERARRPAASSRSSSGRTRSRRHLRDGVVVRAGQPARDNGARLDADDIARCSRRDPRIIGLAELMDFPAVVAGDRRGAGQDRGGRAARTSTGTRPACPAPG